jgi:hypothetical protein
MLMRARELPPLSARWALATACVAVALAFFAIFRVDLAGSPFLSFRHQAGWRSEETLLLSAPGFPISPPAPFGPYRLSGLYAFYAQIAVGPEVRQLVLRAGPLHGDYQAFVLVDGKRLTPADPVSSNHDTQLVASRSYGDLGALEIEGTGRSRHDATSTATRVSRGLRAYVHKQQDAAAIPSAQRVRLIVVSAAANDAERVGSRRLIGPSITLAAVLALLTLALVSGRRSRLHRA